jgi:hypothetical protein
MEMPVEKKEDKTWPIIGTIAAILLCGLPGLCLLCPIAIIVFARGVNTSNVGFELAPGYGAIFLCLSVFFIAIAVLVPILTLRKKKPAVSVVDVMPPQPPLPPQEPLPPAS